MICAKQKDDSPFPALKLVGSIVTVYDLEGREMAHDSGRAITSIVLRLANADDAADHAMVLRGPVSVGALVVPASVQPAWDAMVSAALMAVYAPPFTNFDFMQ